MSMLRSTAGQKRKDSVRNSTGSDQFEISNTAINIETIRCSGCNRIPDKQIFNCLAGHLICDICKPENDICSRKECTEILVRSTVAERILAGITFKCPSTRFGCTETSIKRDQLTSHKKICVKNPNLLGCSQFLNHKCDYQFCTVSVDDDEAIKDMKEHLKSHETEISVTDTICGVTKKEENFFIGELTTGIYVMEVLDWTFGGEPLGTIMVIWVFEEDVNQIKTISRYFVSLADDHKMSFKNEVQLTIKSQPKPESGIGRKCVPNLKWHTMVRSTREFNKILMLTPQQRLIKNYSIPISHLQNYYVNAKGEVNLEYFVSSVAVDKQEKRVKTSSD